MVQYSHNFELMGLVLCYIVSTELFSKELVLSLTKHLKNMLFIKEPLHTKICYVYLYNYEFLSVGIVILH